MMSPRERVAAQIRHQETDFVPYTLGFDQGTGLEVRLDAHFGSTHWRDVLDNAIRALPAPSVGVLIESALVEKPYTTYWTDIYGTKWRLDKRPHELVEPALKEPTLAGYEFPGVEACFDPDWQERAREAIERYRDYFIVAPFGFGLFERVWTLRGFENALADAVLHPTFFEELVERITEHQMGIVERLLELPVDGIFFSDDVSYQDGVLIGPERWRRIFKPRLARMYARVHEAGKIVLSHHCGCMRPILADMIEIGLDVYESVQPEPKGNSPYELKRLYGQDLAFWGGLGSQSILPFGTPAEIKAEVRRLCREMGRGGGFILAPSKSIQPGTPVENAAAAVEAFLEQSGVTLT